MYLTFLVILWLWRGNPLGLQRTRRKGPVMMMIRPFTDSSHTFATSLTLAEGPKGYVSSSILTTFSEHSFLCLKNSINHLFSNANELHSTKELPLPHDKKGVNETRGGQSQSQEPKIHSFEAKQISPSTSRIHSS